MELADQCMEAMGGQAAWDATRVVGWTFFGRRTHLWDRWTGDVRIEDADVLVLMNINTMTGRAFAGGVAITEPTDLEATLKKGHAWWVNDSYWMFMPYKLRDPGVTLRALGADATEDGRAAEKVSLTFDGVGLTPENRYEVWFDAESHLLTQWAFYPTADAVEASFVSPWGAWTRVGDILLSTDRGRAADWAPAVYPELPRAVFEDPAPPALD